MITKHLANNLFLFNLIINLVIYYFQLLLTLFHDIL
jgi:hypothetical protein